MAICVAVDTLFSNRIETLFELWKLRCAVSDKPFLKRLVVVPGSRMKGWLRQKIADDPVLKTTLGIEILPLEEALFFLKNQFISSTKRLPNLFDLSCLIEGELDTLEIEDPSIQRWALASPQKKAHLAQSLARLFQKYGRVSPQSLSDWQKTLWDRIFQEETVWTYPYKSFLEPFRENCPTYEIDLFGLTFLTKLEHTFFSKLKEKASLTFYHLSPCLHFWSDNVAEREKKILLKFTPEAQLERLEELLSDTNPLLANFGKMGREMAKLLEESGSDPVNAYIMPKETLQQGDYDLFDEAAFFTEEKGTLLKQIQTDLLLLRNPKNSPPIARIVNDGSLECHLLPNKAREMEALKDLILRLNTKGIKDIVVMAPDLSLYEPYLEAYMEGIPFTLLDPKSPEETPFTHLLNYYAAPEHEEAAKLLEGASFDPDEIEWLKREYKRLGDFPLRMMGEKCEITKLETWDKATLFFKEIALLTPPESQTLSAWGEWLESLSLEAPQTLIFETKAKGERIKKPITYELFRSWALEMLLREREKKGESRLGGVKFSTLAPIRSTPAEAIILLGMREDAMPRPDVKHPLDLSDGDYSPTQGDFDRALFLETLLSAREHLFILWSGTEAPSKLVQELIDYVEVAFEEPLSPFVHPAFSHDCWYFKENSPFTSFSEEAWRAINRPCEEKKATRSPVKAEKRREPIPIHELEKLLKNPLEFYEKKKGVNKSYKPQFNEPKIFDLSHLEKWSVQNAIVKGKSPSLEGKGLFVKMKQRSGESLEEQFQAFYAQEQFNTPENLYIEPTEEIPLHGVIHGIVEEGVIAEGKDSVKAELSHLPKLLLLQRNDPKKKYIYFPYEGKKKAFSLPSEEILKRWIGYWEKASHMPYPFLPEAIKPLLSKDEKKLNKELEDSIFQGKAKEVIETFHAEAETLFGFLKEVKK